MNSPDVIFGLGFRLFALPALAYIVYKIAKWVGDFRRGVVRVERRYGGKDLYVYERTGEPAGFWVWSLIKLGILLFLLCVFLKLLFTI